VLVGVFAEDRPRSRGKASIDSGAVEVALVTTSSSPRGAMPLLRRRVAALEGVFGMKNAEVGVQQLRLDLGVVCSRSMWNGDAAPRNPFGVTAPRHLGVNASMISPFEVEAERRRGAAIRVNTRRSDLAVS